MMGMAKRFPTYDEYARATLSRTLSLAERRRAFVAEAYELASSYLENLGGGRFALHPLPRPAQAAPLFGMRVGDRNGDGRLDVLLVGNSYAPDSHLGRYDAFSGGVLLGDGRGHFRYRDGSGTGFYVAGDAKALAEVGAGKEGSLFLVTQNDDSLRAFTMARPSSGRSLRLRPDDAYALVTLASGATRREEFHYGDGYLAQSSRSLDLPPGVRGVVIVDARGRRRSAAP
jgi:hypothetical protein